MDFEAVIGLEVHAELQTSSKMFCSCPVVDSTSAKPNVAVCPVCAGMPGVLPVINKRAVEYALRVALALKCEINMTSIFARKNYFYPDLPKGYQISQYEQPLARHGRLVIQTSQGERLIRIRRVHIEEDTGKLTHVNHSGEMYSLVDLNRAGVPLLEIVTEPDLHTAEEVRAYAVALRSLMQYLEVNSGDMQKGVMRIEPNISIRPVGSDVLGIRTEVKNLNSFRALERAVDFEVQRQIDTLSKGEKVMQETRGWDDVREVTFPQRVKEGEDDYRYFPEPDLPPVVIDAAWLDEIRAFLPELPADKLDRFRREYSLNEYDAGILTSMKAVADYFEDVVKAAPGVKPKIIANWITGDLFGLLNQSGDSIENGRIPAKELAQLVIMIADGEVNQNTAKAVLAEMYETGVTAENVVTERGLRQISDTDFITQIVSETLSENPDQVEAYLRGKETISRWFFGQVMRKAKGQANPQVVEKELEGQLALLKIDGK